jgi:hypothetical protein
MNAILEIDADNNWWDEMPDEVKASVENALIESENEKVTPHAEIQKRYHKWIVK